MIFYCLIRESSAAQRDKYGPVAQRRAMERFAGSLPDGPHIVSEQNTVTVVERATAWVRDDWAAAVREGIRRCKAGICNAFVLPRVDR